MEPTRSKACWVSLSTRYGTTTRATTRLSPCPAFYPPVGSSTNIVVEGRRGRSLLSALQAVVYDFSCQCKEHIYYIFTFTNCIFLKNLLDVFLDSQLCSLSHVIDSYLNINKLISHTIYKYSYLILIL